MELREIVLRLTGPVTPVGETNTDNTRFDNLKTLCSLTNELISVIDSVAYDNRNAYEFSVKRAAEYASKTITTTFGIKED